MIELISNFECLIGVIVESSPNRTLRNAGLLHSTGDYRMSRRAIINYVLNTILVGLFIGVAGNYIYDNYIKNDTPVNSNEQKYTNNIHIIDSKETDYYELERRFLFLKIKSQFGIKIMFNIVSMSNKSNKCNLYYKYESDVVSYAGLIKQATAPIDYFGRADDRMGEYIQYSVDSRGKNIKGHIIIDSPRTFPSVLKMRAVCEDGVTSWENIVQNQKQ